MRIDELLTLLSGVRRGGKGWIALCPSHDDTNPSLSLTEKKGKPLLFCHAGCAFSEIMAALDATTPPVDRSGRAKNKGLNGAGPTSTTKTAEGTGPVLPKRRLVEKKPVAWYWYTDAVGQRLYQIVRSKLTYDDGTDDKTFTARRRPNGDEIPEADGWIYNLKGTPLVLYNLSDILDAEVVVVVEGEKDVDTLTRVGIAATCNPFGAGKWRSEYNESLRDKIAAVSPDNDDSGRQHVENVAISLSGAAKEVRLIKLPNLPVKGDVTYYLENGGSVESLKGFIDDAECGTPTVNATTAAKSSTFEFTTLNQLLSEEPENVSFIWEDTLPSGGFSICSAKPKVGKSTLARNLAVAVATGEPFLGRDTAKGRVLYLCLEEKRSEIQKHFQKMGVSSDDILIHTGATPEDALSKLAGVIGEHKPSLLIIDPLSRVIRVTDFNDYGRMARGLEPLVDLARVTGCHIMASHHDSKMDRTGGDSILGSTALFGSVDCHIQLKKRDDRRTILTTQRYGEDMPETVINLEKESGLITDQGDLKSFLLDKAKLAVMASIGDTEALSQAEIKARVEEYSNGTISKAIGSLVEDGKLCRDGEGTKGKPYIYSRPSTGVC